MKEFIVTERLILRKFHLSDIESLFELDSNVEVHRYLGNNPMQTIDQATEIIGSANIENKASRRVLEKCGLEFIENFYWKDIKCDWLNITYEEWAKQQNK
jgi:RimJ/RimL family protein N-acetyltransferase